MKVQAGTAFLFPREQFAAKCLEHVKTFESGRKFSVIEAVPPNEEHDCLDLSAMCQVLRESNVVRVLSEAEQQVVVPEGHRGPRPRANVFERI